MRRLIVTVLVLGLLAAGAFVADQAATSSVEQRLTAAVSAATAGQAAVTLHGWPVGARMLAGTVSRADVHIRDAALPDSPMRLRYLDATLYDVRVDLGGDPFVRSARDGRVTATFDDLDLDEARLRQLRIVLPRVSGSLEGLEDPAVPLVIQAPGGTFEAQLDQDDVEALLGVPRLAVELREGHARLSVGPVGVDAAAEVDDGAILLRPRQPLLNLLLRDVGPLRIRPELPPTAVLTDIELRRGVVRLFGSVDRLELPAAR